VIKRRKRRAQQVKLDFTNHLGVTLPIESDERPAAKMGRHGPGLSAGIFGTQLKKSIALDEDDSEDELMLSNRPLRTPRTASSRKRKRNISLHREDASSPLKTRSGRKAKQAIVVESSEDSDGGCSDEAAPRMTNIHELGEPETTGDEVEALQSSPTKTRRKRPPVPDFIELSDSEDEAAGSDVSVESAPLHKRRLARRQQLESEAEDNEDEDEEGGPVSNSVRRSRTRIHVTNQEIEDLNDDLEWLHSSPPSKLRTQQKKPNARQNALEALKRARASQAGPPTSQPSSESEQEESEEEFVDNRHDMFLEEPEDADFVVVDDPNEPMGAPVDMPLQFSNLSRMKGKDLFKFAVEWMVQMKINPAFASDDEIYELAFRKLDDEVRGLAGSKFTSSAWTMEFTTALRSRPGLALTEYSSLAGDLGLEHCDACNRSGHPATWEIQFTGKPYDPKTLEEMDNESDDEDKSDEEHVEYDHTGKEIPPESKEFHVGRYVSALLSPFPIPPSFSPFIQSRRALSLVDSAKKMPSQHTLSTTGAIT
jgi:hypothetical protein